MMMKEVEMATKFLTYPLLKSINESSIKAKRNRNVYFDRLPLEDDDTRYPVVFSMIHNDREIRTQIMLSGKGESIFLDMSFEEFNALPEAEAGERK